MIDVSGQYLFVVHDCNDESREKIIHRFREFIGAVEEIDRVANDLLESTPGVTATSWVEIFKLAGVRTNWPKNK